MARRSDTQVGCGLCIVGSTVIVMNAPAEADVSSVTEITNRMISNLGRYIHTDIHNVHPHPLYIYKAHI
jgi:hypothetical protein